MMSRNGAEREARCVRVEAMAEGTWLRLERITYHDRQGKERTWEGATRQGGQGAVCMIARLVPSGSFVFIEQFRPPSGGIVLEFSAGLIEPGEPPETTAVRELFEETGYRGEVHWIGKPSPNTPGLSGEAAMLVQMTVDESLPENRHPAQACDEGEEITVYTVAPDGVAAFLADRTAAGVVVDSKIIAFFLGAGVLGEGAREQRQEGLKARGSSST